jgi:hypothetical protein
VRTEGARASFTIFSKPTFRSPFPRHRCNCDEGLPAPQDPLPSMATQAAMNGVNEFVIMMQTGHRAIATLCRHVRLGRIFTENKDGIGI